MLLYTTGENVELLDQVLVGLFGLEFLGTIVYIQGIGTQIIDYKWCEEQELEGVIVEWKDPEIANAYLGTEEIRSQISNFIQISKWDSEDLKFVGRLSRNFR